MYSIFSPSLGDGNGRGPAMPAGLPDLLFIHLHILIVVRNAGRQQIWIKALSSATLSDLGSPFLSELHFGNDKWDEGS